MLGLRGVMAWGRCTRPRFRCGLVVSLSLVSACCRSVSPTVVRVLPPPTPAAHRPPPRQVEPDSTPTYAEMRRVDFRLDPVLTLHIDSLRGRMTPAESAGVISFDDPTSFTLAIGRARVVVDTLSLARLMNHYVFAYPGAPLTEFSFGIRHDTLLVVRGTLHKALPVPFTIGARVTATEAGLIRITPVDIELGPLKVRWLMKALGLTLDDLITARPGRGVRIEGNDLIMSPERMLPPPDIRGRLARLRIVPAGLSLDFLDPKMLQAISPVPAPPDTAAPNFMFFRHGVVRFGKLFMVDADMQVVDRRPADPLDFFLRQYARQLVAGRTRVLPDDGLVVEMPDYANLVEQAR